VGALPPMFRIALFVKRNYKMTPIGVAGLVESGAAKAKRCLFCEHLQIAAPPSLPLAAFSRNLFTAGKMWPFITPVIDWFVARAEHGRALIEVFVKSIENRRSQTGESRGPQNQIRPASGEDGSA
jgi:hypothetical protein